MRVLSVAELHELRGLLVRLFAFAKELREESVLAECIKDAQIPATFSESVVIHLLRKGLLLPQLQPATFIPEQLADIVARRGDEIIRIEVKGTGDTGFQQFGPKDIQSDYLIWVHFGSFFRSMTPEPLKIYIAEKVGRFFPKPRKLSLRLFIATVGSELGKSEFIFDDLK